MYNLYFKRYLDFFGGLVILLLLCPVFLFLLIVLLFINEGRPFFIQKRPGKDEILFKLIKFRTMNNQKDCHGNLLPDNLRLTKFGIFLRKTSLDEIPQLLNILKGDMSLVGPRPLLLKYLPYFTDNERLRHSVRPGITGLAQINGRNKLSWDDRLNLDVEYVRHISFINDFKILLKTSEKVLFFKDIVVDPESLMPNLDDERKL